MSAAGRQRCLAQYGLGALMVVMVAALLGWNISRFLGAAAVMREKDLSFLPTPEVAQLMSMGQASTIAKLRWIDSFAYFEYQLDHKDDHVAGGSSGGVERLYDTLITLDPYFLPYYEHAALNASGVLSKHTLALSFLMRGLECLPHSRELWSNAAALLQVYFHWDKVPQSMTSFLRSWQDAESTQEGKMAVLMWASALSRRQGLDQGMEQISYWFDQLHGSKAGTPTGDFIEANLRLHIDQFATAQLQHLVDDYCALHGGEPPGTPTDAGLPAALRLPTGILPVLGLPARLEDLLDLNLLRHRYPHGLPLWGAITLNAGTLALRDDPYGHPWHYENGVVSSPGRFRLEYGIRVSKVNNEILKEAKTAGSWPSDLAAITRLGIVLPEPLPPPGGTVALVDHGLVVHWDPPAGQPWALR